MKVNQCRPIEVTSSIHVLNCANPPFDDSNIIYTMNSAFFDVFHGKKVKLSASDTVSAQQGRLVFAHFFLSRPSKQVVTASRSGAEPSGTRKDRCAGQIHVITFPSYPISITQNRINRRKRKRWGKSSRAPIPATHRSIDSQIRRDEPGNPNARADEGNPAAPGELEVMNCYGLWTEQARSLSTR
jgi:hypothetical protein